MAVMSTARPAAVAGSFYPADPAILTGEVNEFLDGVENFDVRFGHPKVLVVPHAGYVYSGQTAAYAYNELATAKARTDGAISSLLGAGLPQNRIFKAPVRTTDIPGSLDAANILLTQQPNVKHWLVCGSNDNLVLGGVRALEGRGFTADTAVAVGINGTDCIVELEKAKPTPFFGSMLLSAKSHGYETAKMMFQWIKDGKEPALDTRTVGVLITRENFRQVLKEQGVRD